MKNIRHLVCVLVTALLSPYSYLSAQETTFKTNGPDDYREGMHVFVNATLYKDYKTKIENATLVIREGKVVDAGAGVGIPMGAIVHDMKGKYIYPSFVDIFTDYGVPPTPKIMPSEDGGVQYESNIKGAYGWNQAIKADYEAYKNFIVNDSKADELRKLGFGAVLTHRKDGIARGTGAVVTLGNDKENKVIIKGTAAAMYSFNKGTSTQEYPSSLMGTIALLRQTYLDALWYKTLTEKKEYNISLEAWNSNLALPQLFDAGQWMKTLRADKVGDEFGTQYIIKGNGTEYQRIAEIKATGAKLIIPLIFPKVYDVEDPYKALWVSLDDMKHWELAPANAAALTKAGIDCAFTTADIEKKEDFLKALRTAVKYGLKEEDALKALTLNPAQFLNVQNQIGTLEKGKLANFFITSKPIFDDKAVINENWIQGRRYEITKFEPKDIRGDYKLSLTTINPNITLKIAGEQTSPKATVGIDTNKIEVKMDYKEDDVTLSYNPDKKKVNNKYLLTGTIDHSTKAWKGKGQSPDGTWFDWSATFVSAHIDTAKPPKKDTIDLNAMSKVMYPFNAYGNEEIPTTENVLFHNATVWTNEKDGIIKNTDVVIKAGKIAAIGTNLSCPECKNIDASNKHLTAGIIDEHNHIAISEGVNEGTKASSAEVRIGDVINSEDINMYRQLSGGVVAAQLLHGSANPIGGQSALIKFRWGYAPEKLKIEGADGFIKFALGENVKQSNWGDKFRVRYPQTRMGVEQTYYNYFTRAREYQAALKVKDAHPRRDIELECLAEILNKKRFITCHSYVQSEINMLMHVADSFGFKVNTFTHILEGYKVADKMKAHGVNASTFSDWWAYKYEVIDAIPYNATILNKMGVNTAINSDDAEMARRLNQEAAKIVKYGGTSEEAAWKMVTLNPAKMLHLDSHMGSIKVGKDADIVLWDNNPLSVYASVDRTYVDGICFYDKEKDIQKRDYLRRERARLTQKMLDEKKSGAATQEPLKKANKAYSCGGSE